MSLDKKLLQDVFNQLGLEVEFNSSKPGLVVGSSIYKWDDIPLFYSHFDNKMEEKIKTTKVKNVPTKKLSQNVTSKYKPQSQQSITTSGTWRLVA